MAISRVQNWWQSHPRITSLLLAVGGMVTAYGALEAVWATIRDDPLVPVLGKALDPLWDDILRVVGVLFLVGLAALLIRPHLNLSEVFSEISEREYAYPTTPNT